MYKTKYYLSLANHFGIKHNLLDQNTIKFLLKSETYLGPILKNETIIPILSINEIKYFKEKRLNIWNKINKIYEKQFLEKELIDKAQNFLNKSTCQKNILKIFENIFKTYEEKCSTDSSFEFFKILKDIISKICSKYT
jgi:hypothetical protein